MKNTVIGLAAVAVVAATSVGAGQALGAGQTLGSRQTRSAPAGHGTSADLATTGEAVGIRLPPSIGVFDYQLGGPADRVVLDGQARDVTVMTRDATQLPAAGAYSICYVNGFQTQPQDADLWREHDDLLLKDGDGEPVVDPDWPDEYVLDPSTPAQRAEIVQIVGPQVRRCASAGFSAVEIDNLDTFTRFPDIQQEAALALAADYVELAHSSGLAIGQKNAAELTRLGKDQLGFDFAVAEECAAQDECSSYRDVYGDAFLQIEYPEALDEAGATFEQVCRLSDRAPLTILRDRDLVPAGASGHLYRSC